MVQIQHNISDADKAILKTMAYSVERRLYVDPRTPIFKAQVNGTPPRDTKTKGFYQVTFDTVTLGSVGVIEADMTVMFGTTAGAGDIGSVRVRSASGTTLKIAETAPGLLSGLADNVYITVLNTFDLWSVAPRLVAERASSGQISGFTMYMDYEKTYAAQNKDIQPLVNVFADPAGNIDSGQTYRTVTFIVTTTPIKAGATPANPTFDWKDGTVTAGPTHVTSGNVRTTTTTVRFPQATYLRWIKITGADNAGTTAIRRFPIWVGGTTSPITKFKVTRDDSTLSGGRAMGFELFSNTSDEFDAEAVPERTLVCYWEKAIFSTGTTPAQYRDQYLGWTTQRGTLLKVRNRGRLALNTAGPAYWLSKMRGWSVTVSDSSAPTKWQQLDGITNDRWTHMWLRCYTTFLNLFNLYFSEMTREAEEEKINRGSIWSQLTKMNEGYALTRVSCDTLGGMWLRPEYRTLSGTDRAARNNIIGVTPEWFTDSKGLEIADEYEQKVGVMPGAGGYWDGESSTQFKALAPGRTPGQAESQQEAPYQRLPATTPETTMLQWLSDYYALANNTRVNLPAELLYNLDVVEPAWNAPVNFAWQEPSITGLTLSSVRFIVTKVSIRHSNERGQFPKRIVWAIDQLTTGGGAQRDFPVTSTSTSSSDSEGSETPQTLYPSLVTPQTPAQVGVNPVFGNGALAFLNSQRTLNRTANFYIHSAAGSPAFDSVSLQTLGISGTETLTQFVVDGSSRGTGSIAGWFTTNLKIWRLTNIFGSPAVASQYTIPRANVADNIDFDYLHPGDIGKFGVYVYRSSGANHLFVVVTTDGVNWTEVKEFANNNSTSGLPGVFIDPHEAGVAWLFARDAADSKPYLYKMSGYGSTFTLHSEIYDAGGSHGPGALMPYLDTSSIRIFHGSTVPFGAVSLMKSTVDVGMVDVPLLYNGSRYLPRGGRWGMSMASQNRNRLLVAATNSAGGTKGMAIVDNIESASPLVTWIFPPGANTVGYYKGVLLDPYGDKAILLGDQTGYRIAYYDGNSVDERGGVFTAGGFVGICAND